MLAMTSNSTTPVAWYPFSKKKEEVNNKNVLFLQSHDDDESSSLHRQQVSQDVETGLRQLKAELASIPDDMKVSFVHAQRIAPDLVNDEHLSAFLYAEKFNTEVSFVWHKNFPRSLILIAKQ